MVVPLTHTMVNYMSTPQSLSFLQHGGFKSESCIIFYDLALEITNHSHTERRAHGPHISVRRISMSCCEKIKWDYRYCCHHLGKWNLLHLSSFAIIVTVSHQIWSHQLLSLWTHGNKYIWCILIHLQFCFYSCINSFYASDSLFIWHDIPRLSDNSSSQDWDPQKVLFFCFLGKIQYMSSFWYFKFKTTKFLLTSLILHLISFLPCWKF